MGFAVIGGMLAASFIAIFIIPVTYCVVQKLSERGGDQNRPQLDGSSAHGAGGGHS
jgi:HAE1 family hydrophobic/amphiphilic exporter-1